MTGHLTVEVTDGKNRKVKKETIITTLKLSRCVILCLPSEELNAVKERMYMERKFFCVGACTHCIVYRQYRGFHCVNVVDSGGGVGGGC